MADDDAEDCWLASQAFAESGANAAFSCVLDGIELLDYLTEHSRSQVKRLPDLILLDLNMPRKNGWQALIEIKAESALQHIPIVILTSSQERADVNSTLKTGAKSFITKPATFDEWVEMMRSLADNWLR
jgi:CheY-like chemotaxis protein